MVATRVSLAAIALWIFAFELKLILPKRTDLIPRLFIQGCLACIFPCTLFVFGQRSVDTALCRDPEFYDAAIRLPHRSDWTRAFGSVHCSSLTGQCRCCDRIWICYLFSPDSNDRQHGDLSVILSLPSASWSAARLWVSRDMDGGSGPDGGSPWRRSDQSKGVIVVRAQACNACRGDELESTW
jgi:hypothetical protein